VTYFAALLARHGDDWKGEEVDLADVADLDTLADLLADAADDDEPVLLVVEQEDEWFALVRVDGDDTDVRVFVSDGQAAAASTLAPLLLPEVADETRGDGAGAPFVDAGPDRDLLADLGVAESDLVDLSEDGVLPADALSSVADEVGCLEALERLR
jgi:putative tRNA adenosine deaminase-associated protein